MMIAHNMVTTAFELDGYQIKRSLGIVRGITVRSRSILGTLGGTLHTIVGGNITAFTNLCEKAREEAFQLMLQHASQMGANAVIGMRAFTDHNSVEGFVRYRDLLARKSDVAEAVRDALVVAPPY